MYKGGLDTPEAAGRAHWLRAYQLRETCRLHPQAYTGAARVPLLGIFMGTCRLELHRTLDQTKRIVRPRTCSTLMPFCAR